MLMILKKHKLIKISFKKKVYGEWYGWVDADKIVSTDGEATLSHKLIVNKNRPVSLLIYILSVSNLPQSFK